MYQLDFFDKTFKFFNMFNLQSIIFDNLYIFSSYVDYFFPNMLDFLDGITFYNFNKNMKIKFIEMEHFTKILSVDDSSIEISDFYLKTYNLYNLILLTYKLDAIYLSNINRTNISNELNSLNNCKYCLFSSNIVQNETDIGNLDSNLNFCTFYYQKENVLIFSFNGSNSFKKWMNNFLICKSYLPLDTDVSKDNSLGKSVMVHLGILSLMTNTLLINTTQYKNFNFGFDEQVSCTLLEFIFDIIIKFSDKDTKIYFNGHSLGAALCSCLFYMLCIELTKKNICVKNNLYLYCFGCPKFSNENFESGIDLNKINFPVKNVYYFVNDNDFISKVPFCSYNNLLDYNVSFPSRIFRLHNSSYSSFFNIPLGIINHNTYDKILKKYYLLSKKKEN